MCAGAWAATPDVIKAPLVDRATTNALTGDNLVKNYTLDLSTKHAENYIWRKLT